jgi:hypothetical protein
VQGPEHRALHVLLQLVGQPLQPLPVGSLVAALARARSRATCRLGDLLTHGKRATYRSL